MPARAAVKHADFQITERIIIIGRLFFTRQKRCHLVREDVFALVAALASATEAVEEVQVDRRIIIVLV